MNPADFIGKAVEELPTPALIVDIEALEYNLTLLAEYFSSRPAKLRPHFKSNKCVTLAKRQLMAGSAVGITCAKISEAEALVSGGVTDVLIANQVVGADKARRLAKLNQEARVRCALDSVESLESLAKAATEAGTTIGVLVEVDIGMRRCGVAAGQPTLDLARKAAETKGIIFDGLQAYEGHLVTTPDFDERKRKVESAMQAVIETKTLIERSGLVCPIISGGGTGTYQITGNIAGFSEIQSGSYALMDCSYKKVSPEFRNAMHVLATIVSSSPTHAVADVGLKGMGNEFGMPQIVDAPEAKPRSIAEEHLVIDNFKAKPGAKVRIIPSHGCTTSNLHRRLWSVRKGIVEAMWPIEASGALE